MNHSRPFDGRAPHAPGTGSPGGVVDAVLRESARLLEALAADADSVGAIDLHALSLNVEELARLRNDLGAGEVVVKIGEGEGATSIAETGYAGVWWMRLGGPEAGPAIEQIVVAQVPPLVPAHTADIAEAARRLAARLAPQREATTAGPAMGQAEGPRARVPPSTAVMTRETCR